jgi:ribonucleoside-triphosphate reductase
MAKAVVKHNYEFGFNDINIMNVDEVTSLASCCRLVSNKVELKKHKVFNSIGGSELNVGSTKVVTINLVRYALNANNQEEFLADIEKQVRLIHKYHYAQRNCLKKLITKGLLPLYSHKLMDLEDQFATIGINGVFEAMYLLGGIDSDESGVFYNETGFEIANNMFELINQLNDETYEKYGYMSNVEQVPAESAAVKLNKKDRIIFGNLKIDKLLGADCDIYGNQWIPLKESSSVFNRIEAAKLDNKCGGGAILHINLGENFNSFEDAYTFTKGLANSGVRYFSYISLINICEDEHSYLTEDCPVCGKETVSKGIKIVGYLVKQDSYKSERKRELQDRKFYTL